MSSSPWNCVGAKTDVRHGWYFSSPPPELFSQGSILSIRLYPISPCSGGSSSASAIFKPSMRFVNPVSVGKRRERESARECDLRQPAWREGTMDTCKIRKEGFLRRGHESRYDEVTSHGTMRQTCMLDSLEAIDQRSMVLVAYSVLPIIAASHPAEACIGRPRRCRDA